MGDDDRVTAIPRHLENEIVTSTPSSEVLAVAEVGVHVDVACAGIAVDEDEADGGLGGDGVDEWSVVVVEDVLDYGAVLQGTGLDR